MLSRAMSRVGRVGNHVMRSNFTAAASSTAARAFSCKAAVCGAAGGIGQPLAMLLKLDPNITELALYDVAPVVAGVA